MDIKETAINSKYFKWHKDGFEEYKKISFRYAGSDDQGEYVDGSGFTLGPFSKKYIDKYKSISFDDEFDADSGVEWDKREF